MLFVQYKHRFWGVRRWVWWIEQSEQWLCVGNLLHSEFKWYEIEIFCCQKCPKFAKRASTLLRSGRKTPTGLAKLLGNLMEPWFWFSFRSHEQTLSIAWLIVFGNLKEVKFRTSLMKQKSWYVRKRINFMKPIASNVVKTLTWLFHLKRV